MKRGEWWPEAERLKAEGMSQTEIARKFGVSDSAVTKALNPERRAAYNARTMTTRDRERHAEINRAYYERTMHPCADCGELVSRVAERCTACDHALRQRRRERIHQMWHEGRRIREIAAELGSTVNAVGTTIVYMRRAGWDMPYRYPAWAEKDERVVA